MKGPTMSTQATVTPSLRHLDATDRCDRCGAQAYTQYTLHSGGELLFCNHHNREHADAIQPNVVAVIDESWVLAAEERAKTLSKHTS